MADIRFLIRRLTSSDVLIKTKYVTPHYKSLKKTYKKESNQVFFRETLDGKFVVFGEDYDFINEGSVENKFQLIVYKDIDVYVWADFNKTDCKFNHSKKSVEIKLSSHDKYTDILAKYENKYDLLKETNPTITSLTLTKRCIVQIYVQGEETVSSYAGGTYWETDVNEVIDDADALRKKYYFSIGPSFSEILIEGFEYPNIDDTYYVDPNKSKWLSKNEGCYIEFVKEHSKGDDATIKNVAFLHNAKLHTDADPIYEIKDETAKYLYDMYYIYIKDSISDKVVYKSDMLYAKRTDDNFDISDDKDKYKMVFDSQASASGTSEPKEFYLSNNFIKYNVWGRIICDIDKVETIVDGETKYIDLYDLPYDDFAIERANYKKCIGLVFSNTSDSVCKIYQSTRSSTTPNSYGINDYGEYFMPPYDPSGQIFYPVARSSWANTSIWIQFVDAGFGVPYDYETWVSRYFKKYLLRNAYHIADVISALLSKIAPGIKHEATGEYSQFLYSQTDGLTRGALGGCQIYITPKSNILKGEYDQAAQKAEISFKQIMDMLRDCYRCYWYIKDDKLIIEHITYFINGLNYSTPLAQLDLTTKNDKFTKLNCLYGQREIEYDKTELYSRYDFSWADDSTDSMGNLKVDVNNSYIQKDNNQDINIDVFSSDIDYMLFMPSDFSSDGFALLMAKNKIVPIIRTYLKYDKYYNARMLVNVQNWYASFNNLIAHYLYDMPGDNISYNNIYTTLRVAGTKRFIKHQISIINKDYIDIYRLIETEEGKGYIDEMSVELSTGVCDITLMYAL